MYTSSLHFERTIEEKTDQELSWQRPDRAFFASGACHILAYTFVEVAQRSGLEIIFVKPAEVFGNVGTHVYVVDGDWVFDASGWVQESELLTVLQRDYAAAHPGWTYERVVLHDDLETFCKHNAHSLPEDFADDVADRAKNYLKSFSLHPPKNSVG